MTVPSSCFSDKTAQSAVREKKIQKLMDFCVGQFLLLLIRFRFDLPGMTPGLLVFKASFENGLYCRTVGIPAYQANLLEKQRHQVLAEIDCRTEEHRSTTSGITAKLCICFEWHFFLSCCFHILPKKMWLERIVIQAERRGKSLHRREERKMGGREPSIHIFSHEKTSSFVQYLAFVFPNEDT